jgi:peptidyl-prolyl cis-trans isomerase B (cyclophilin B)
VAPSKNTEREAREARDRLRRYNARQAVHAHQVKRRFRDNLWGVIGLVVVAALAAGTQIVYFTVGPGMSKPAASASPSASPSAAAGGNVGAVPAKSVAEDRTWTGTLTLNSVKLGISLNGKAAPQAVAAFVTDARDEYLDGKLCWRLVQQTDFGILQCGAVSAAGADPTGYSFGPLENTPAGNVYPAGSIVLARTTNNAYGQGHQFFITLKSTKIDADSAGGYSVFGKITSGLAELESKITSKGVTAGTGSVAPKVSTKITAVVVK